MNNASSSSFGSKSMEIIVEWLVTIMGYVICFLLVIGFAFLHPKEACRSVANVLRPGLSNINQKTLIPAASNLRQFARSIVNDGNPLTRKQTLACTVLLLSTVVLITIAVERARMQDRAMEQYADQQGGVYPR